MRISLMLVISFALTVTISCRKRVDVAPEPVLQPVVVEVAAAPPPGPISDLIVEFDHTGVDAMWGLVTEVPINIAWRSGQKYAVTVIPVDIPAGLDVESVPSIVDPPGQATLRIMPAIGEAPQGSHVIAIEASGYGLKNPVRNTLIVNVIREDGEFIPVHAGTVTVECRNVCAQFAGGRVTFYDVVREQEQSCGSLLPASQQIGTRNYAVSDIGFGFGRTCRVAAIFDPNGALSLINIGAPTRRVPRGEMITTIPDVEQCWLSPDNTLALVKKGSFLRLFAIYSAQEIGTECMLEGDMPAAEIFGNNVSVGECIWNLD